MKTKGAVSLVVNIILPIHSYQLVHSSYSKFFYQYFKNDPWHLLQTFGINIEEDREAGTQRMSRLTKMMKEGSSSWQSSECQWHWSARGNVQPLGFSGLLSPGYGGVRQAMQTDTMAMLQYLKCKDKKGAWSHRTRGLFLELGAEQDQ